MRNHHKCIKGWAYQGNKTKLLVEQLQPGGIAILNHRDIDVVAAEMLIEKKVKAIINLDHSMTGNFVHNGVHVLLKERVHVFDLITKKTNINLNRKKVKVEDKQIFIWSQKRWEKHAELMMYDDELVKQLKDKAVNQFPLQFEKFVNNSFAYGQKELSSFINRFPRLALFHKLEGKDILIVARGAHYLADLKATCRILRNKKDLITIAVDGGADGLLACRMKVDFIIGDMDSVSEKALKSGAELIAHSYPNGKSPGGVRLSASGHRYYSIPFIGTSEDVALMTAYYGGAKNIYLIGGHNSMNEFLEKGRKGMGSSLLARMKIGHQIIDLKGIHQLYNSGQTTLKPISLVVSVATILILVNMNPRFEVLFSIFIHWLKMEVL